MELHLAISMHAQGLTLRLMRLRPIRKHRSGQTLDFLISDWRHGVIEFANNLSDFNRKVFTSTGSVIGLNSIVQHGVIFGDPRLFPWGSSFPISFPIATIAGRSSIHTVFH